MIYKNKQKGVGLIEIIIIISIIILISKIIFSSLSDFGDIQALRNTTSDVVSLLNKARQDTLSSVNSNSYGVHFENDRAIFFIGPTYSSSSGSNVVLMFNNDVIIPSSGGLNIGGSNVLFERLTGDTVGGTIKLQLSSDSSKYKIITISKTGSISFQ